MPTNYAAISGHKRPKPVSDGAEAAPRRLADFSAPSAAPPKALPWEASEVLGPELANHFHGLVECEERIDLALERAREELHGAVPSEQEVAGLGLMPSLVGLNPRPLLRRLRVFVHSERAPPASTDGAQPSAPCAWRLKIWAALHSAPVDGGAVTDSAPSSSSAASHFTDPVALSRYFQLIHVHVDSSPQPTASQWPAASVTPAGGGGGANGDDASSAICIELGRTTDVPPGGGLTAKVSMRMRRATVATTTGLSPGSRVKLSAEVARLLCLPADSYVVYADLEESFWLLLKERRLLEARKETDEQRNVRLSRPGPQPTSDLVANVRVGAANARDLRTLLGIPHDKQLATLQEMRHFLCRTIHYWEPPDVAHTIAPGECVSCFDMIVADEEPLHAHRQAALQQLHAQHAECAAPLAALDDELSGQMAAIARTARKVRWLDALLHDDEAGGEAHGEGAPGAGSDAAKVEGGSGAEQDATQPPPGKRPRSVSDFAQVLFDSQLHASRHALRPGMLRSAVQPPLLPTDEPLDHNSAAHGFDAPWVGWAIKSYLGDRHVRRR